MKTRGQRASRSHDTHLLSLGPIATNSITEFFHVGELLWYFCVAVLAVLELIQFYDNAARRGLNNGIAKPVFNQFTNVINSRYVCLLPENSPDSRLGFGNESVDRVFH